MKTALSRHFGRTLVALLLAFSTVRLPAASEQHFLNVANPGTRNYVEYGGVGILVFDVANGYKFVRRIPTWDVPEGKVRERQRDRGQREDRQGLRHVAEPHDRD